MPLRFPLHLVGDEGAHAKRGKVRGRCRLADASGRVFGSYPLTLPLLRNGPLPLPQGERRFYGASPPPNAPYSGADRATDRQ